MAIASRAAVRNQSTERWSWVPFVGQSWQRH